jgi:predicted small secreted protein
MVKKTLCAVLLAPLILTACKTSDAGTALQSAGDTVAGAASSVPSLVNVDLRNVLNDLSVDLNLDRANIPINAQIPITLAANVCGVSVNILSASTGGQANCTANTTSPELAQVVQQQVAAGGSVGGGAQGGSTADTSTTGGATAPSAGGASGPTGTSPDTGASTGTAGSTGTTTTPTQQ